MASAGVRKLKDNLSRYIRRIEAGERVSVTAHGRVVAELSVFKTYGPRRDDFFKTFPPSSDRAITVSSPGLCPWREALDVSRGHDD